MRERLSRVDRRSSEDTERSGVPQRPLTTSDSQRWTIGWARPSGAGLFSPALLLRDSTGRTGTVSLPHGTSETRLAAQRGRRPGAGPAAAQPPPLTE
jgi:hypothetical protein